MSTDREGAAPCHAYPTPAHERAADAATSFFAGRAGVSAVLLTGSCARGRAVRDSCLDLCVLVEPAFPAEAAAALRAAWEAHHREQAVYRDLEAAGRYAFVDLDISDGSVPEDGHGWTTGPDEMELAIGNLLVYSAPLYSSGGHLDDLRSRWLPYYGDELRRTRLAMVLKYCRNNLDHIDLYVPRGLFFQSFHRLYNAYRELLQALHIARRVYPIAYDKWIKEQIVGILGLDGLYPRLVALLQVRDLESDELMGKAEQLRHLIATEVEPLA